MDFKYMNLSPAPFPLNHFLTDLHQPDKTPLQVLKKKVCKLEWKAKALGALEKICYAALIAIMGIILFISHSNIILSALTAFAVIGSAILIAFSLPKIASLRQHLDKTAKIEGGVALHLKEIEEWKTGDIEKFLEKQNIGLQKEKIDLLKQINEKDPLRALLPLIARFNYLDSTATEIKKEVQQASLNCEEALKKKQIELGEKKIDPEKKAKIRFEWQSTASQQAEEEALPLHLNAAVLRRIMKNPSDQRLDIRPETLEIPDLGRCTPKSFPERMFAQKYHPEDNIYFRFNPALNKPPLSFQSVENKSAQELEEILYTPPSAV